MESGAVLNALIQTNINKDLSIILSQNMLWALVTFVKFVKKFVPQKMHFVYTDQDTIGIEFFYFFSELENLFEKRGNLFVCLECGKTAGTRQNIRNHVESKHVVSPGYVCNICNKFCQTKNALALHRSRYHRN